MSEKINCSTCKFFKVDLNPQNKTMVKACYFNPPSLFGFPTADGKILWLTSRPQVSEDSFCGHGVPVLH
jgi:hypothetical protein